MRWLQRQMPSASAPWFRPPIASSKLTVMGVSFDQHLNGNQPVITKVTEMRDMIETSYGNTLVTLY